MIAAGTRVDADVSGSFEWLKDPEALETYVLGTLPAYGAVLRVDVDSGWFSERYTATVSFITSAAHASVEDLRAIVAGVFESWNGIRPSVTIISEGEARQAPVASPILPGLTWPAVDTSTLVLGGAIVALLVFAPVLWRAAR